MNKRVTGMSIDRYIYLFIYAQTIPTKKLPPSLQQKQTSPPTSLPYPALRRPDPTPHLLRHRIGPRHPAALAGWFAGGRHQPQAPLRRRAFGQPALCPVGLAFVEGQIPPLLLR